MALIYPEGLTASDFADGNSGPGLQPQNYLYGSHIIIPSSGTVTQLGARIKSGGGGVTVKLGLYTSGGVLLAQSSATATGGMAWQDSGAISASVSAGLHFVMMSASTVNAEYGYDTSGDGSYATEAYATAMAATESITLEGEAGALFGVRLDFTAGGGGAASLLPRVFGKLFSQLFHH